MAILLLILALDSGEPISWRIYEKKPYYSYHEAATQWEEMMKQILELYK